MYQVGFIYTIIHLRFVRKVHISHIIYNELGCGRQMGDITCKTETKWNDSFIMDVKEIECEVVGWINLYPHRGKWRAVVDMGMNLLVS